MPADGELIVEDGMYFNEAILTGESMPVAKKVGSEAYMGTVVGERSGGDAGGTNRIENEDGDRQGSAGKGLAGRRCRNGLIG